MSHGESISITALQYKRWLTPWYMICNVALTFEVKYQTCKAHSEMHRKNKSLTLFFFFSVFFLFDIFLESESIHKTSFVRLLIEWRKLEDFLQLYLGTHYVIEPSHYGTYFELKKEIISRLYSWIIFFLIFGILLSILFFTILFTIHQYLTPFPSTNTRLNLHRIQKLGRCNYLRVQPIIQTVQGSEMW